MSAQVKRIPDDIEAVICAKCNIRFGLPAGYLRARKHDYKAFYCPEGHSLSYPDPNKFDWKQEAEHLRSVVNAQLEKIKELEESQKKKKWWRVIK